jgi:hypothetical protein
MKYDTKFTASARVAMLSKANAPAPPYPHMLLYYQGKYIVIKFLVFSFVEKDEILGLNYLVRAKRLSFPHVCVSQLFFLSNQLFHQLALLPAFIDNVLHIE